MAGVIGGPNWKGERGPWEAFSSSKSYLHNLGPNSLSLTKLPPSPSSKGSLGRAGKR